MLKFPPWILVWATAAVITGCSKAPAEPSPADERVAETARPSDPGLSQKYERACMTCHASRASKAPLTGFVAQWQPRLQQGMPTLVAHARDGFQGMPARGFCNDCNDQDFAALIAFMSQQPASKE